MLSTEPTPSSPSRRPRPAPDGSDVACPGACTPPPHRDVGDSCGAAALPPVPDADPGDAALVLSLTESVDAALARQWAAGDPSRSVLLRVTADQIERARLDADGSGAVELGVLDLDGGHPLDALLGLVAPPDWMALGVAASGRALDLAGDRRAERVHITLLLTRSGASASVLRRGEQVSYPAGPTEGVVADASRRALGLPTAPPPGSTAELWTRWWLDSLVRAALERPAAAPPPSWDEAVALHPASFMGPPGPSTAGCALRPAPPASAPAQAPAVEPAELAADTRALAAAWDWGSLRADPSVVDAPRAALTRALARWMDDGMAARWLLATFPLVDDLLDACCSVLPQATARRVERVVTATLGDNRDEPSWSDGLPASPA
jgi:hypothetical protein